MENKVRKKRKNRIFKLLVFTFTFCSTLYFEIVNINAKENISNEKAMIQSEIDDKTNEYLNSIGKKSFEQLSDAENKELSLIIQEVKHNYASFYEKGNKKITTRGTSPYYGDVLATTDESKFGIKHGHAGIGYYDSDSAIEANPDVGVKLYANRISTYWMNCADGGIYSIHGAINNEYAIATDYAYNHIGYDYGFLPIVSDFYCSELVYYAWKEAGYDLRGGSLPGTVILPIHLMKDADTYLKVAAG